MPFISVVIPVYNGGPEFRQCLDALRASTFADWDLIVVDDGSTDGSESLAREYGGRVLKTSGTQGPAAARNQGVQEAARGKIVFFTDADCAVHIDTLTKVAHAFNSDKTLDALFGSYDDAPQATNFVSQYKNLFHHYVHQTASSQAATFWTGCGAIKRTQFLSIGGFDAERYPTPSIEDIGLGTRLVAAGGQIRLIKDIQVKHLKRWTLASLLHSDVVARGIPWTRLLWETGNTHAGLNTRFAFRLSTVLSGLWVIGIAGMLIWRWTGLLALLATLCLLALNWPVYRFLADLRGWWFSLRAIGLNWLYHFYSGIAFVIGSLLHFTALLRGTAGSA